MFCDRGYEERIAILDLAPEAREGVEGKMEIPSQNRLYYLTGSISAPRLSGKSEEGMKKIVSGNWRVIFKFIGGDAYIVDYDDYH